MADPYRTPGAVEVEALQAELSILRQANGMLSIKVAELKEVIEQKERTIRYVESLRSKSVRASQVELTDLLRAALVFLKQADKKGVFGRHQGVSEIIMKIEGVPEVK